MKKRSLSLIIAMAILFSPIIAGIQITAQSKISEKKEIIEDTILDQKVYSTITLEDDFEDDTIILVLNKARSQENRAFTPKDFPEIDCAEIRDLTSDMKNKIRQQEAAIKEFSQQTRSSMNSYDETVFQLEEQLKEGRNIPEELLDVDQRGIWLIDAEKFRTILHIKIKNPGKENVLRAIRKLEERKDIISAEPDTYTTNPLLSTRPNDTHLSEQWAINHIGLPEAWSITTGSNRRITVGVIDGGVFADHADFKRSSSTSIVSTTLGQNFGNDGISHRNDPTSNGHGTSVAGIIGAVANNNLGIAGVNWNVNIVSLKIVTPNQIKGNNSWLTGAITYATQNGIPLLNMSIGNYAPSPFVHIAISLYPGLIICGAANNGSDNDINRNYPSAYSYFHNRNNMITVGGTAFRSDSRYSLINPSNYGAASVDLFAPGEKILSTVPSLVNSTGYTMQLGTSFAAPHVTGVAALILSINPDLPVHQLKNIILNSVDKRLVLSGLCSTGGRINAHRAIHYAAQKGWQQVAGNWYYYFNGSYLTDWRPLGPHWYHFNNSGVMQTDWVQTSSNGRWYYLRPSANIPSSGPKGSMCMGWQKIDNYWYYFRLEGSGRMETGWQQINGSWYYLRPSRNYPSTGPGGSMVTGWQNIDGTLHFFNSSGVWIP